MDGVAVRRGQERAEQGEESERAGGQEERVGAGV